MQRTVPVDSLSGGASELGTVTDMAAQPSDDNELDLGRPFTRADAIRAGLDPKILRGSRFRRLFRGVYVLRSVPVSPILRTEAALALHPSDAFASHLSAARVLGLPVPDGHAEHVSVFDQRDRRTRPGIVPHVAPASARVVSYKGLRVSAPLHTFVDLAGVLSLVDLVVVGDALVRVFRLEPEQLVAACEASGSRYAAAAARAARLVRAEVDSPMESRLRMLIVLAGLPEPEVNHTIRDEYGAVIARLDLSYPHLKLIVEYDGRQHAESSAQWQRDLERREMFDNDGWRILVVTAKGIYKEPERTLQRVRAALVSRGSTGVPRHLSEEWRPYFPERP
jgi:very-short-patch-repair endonuclease